MWWLDRLYQRPNPPADWESLKLPFDLRGVSVVEEEPFYLDDIQEVENE